MKMSQVLSYGFEYFCAPNFQLETSIPSQTRRVGEEVIYIISTLSIYLTVKCELMFESEFLTHVHMGSDHWVAMHYALSHVRRHFESSQM